MNRMACGIHYIRDRQPSDTWEPHQTFTLQHEVNKQHIKINKQEIVRITNCLISFDKARTAEEKFPTILPLRRKVFTDADTQADPQTLLWYDVDRTQTDAVRQFSCCIYSLPQERIYQSIAQQRQEGIHIETHKLICSKSSGAMIHVHSFKKIASDIQTFSGVYRETDTHRQQDDIISLLLFF